MPIQNLDMSEFSELRDYIVEGLAETGQNVPTWHIANRLLDFGDKYDLSAMFRFKEWMETHGYDKGEILATLVHDLNGTNDICFLPRTSSY
jgi:hypothetical protein